MATQGEIDIIEFRGGNTNEYVCNFLYGSQANMPLTNSSVTSFTYDAGTDLTSEFHVFDLVWSEDSLIMSLDGTVVRILASDDFEYIDDLFDKNEKIVLNMAVGGAFFNGTNLIANDIPDTLFKLLNV